MLIYSLETEMLANVIISLARKVRSCSYVLMKWKCSVHCMCVACYCWQRPACRFNTSQLTAQFNFILILSYSIDFDCIMLTWTFILSRILQHICILQYHWTCCLSGRVSPSYTHSLGEVQNRYIFLPLWFNPPTLGFPGTISVKFYLDVVRSPTY